MFPADTRILVVDDAESMRQLIKGLLVEIGYNNVAEAADGNQAFDIITQEDAQKTPIQLVLTDWHMPELDGVELMKSVRSVFGNIPFILITTEGESKNVVTAIVAGANNYIVKPVTKQVLEQKLSAVWSKAH